MCFRPADADGGGMECPECGKTVQAMGGVPLKRCPFCKCDFTPYLNGEKEYPSKDGGAAAAPGAPAAPKAPGAPKAPAAPKAPGAPAAPKAPGA